MISEDRDIALEARELAKRFVAKSRTTEALKGVNLQVEAGRVTGLIGPDGAGKTTFLRLAAGLMVPDSGGLRVLGLDTVSQALAVQAAIGYMPQRFGLYGDLTVQENLDLYANLQGVPAEERDKRYPELMSMTGLGPFTGRLARFLSGGMKQKLGLACTLVRAPRLLLLDEPTVGVDPVSRRELWDIVYRLVEEAGMTVVLSTAYMDEAERCHDVALLHEGNLLGHRSPRDFSEPLRGRVYTAAVPEGATKRDIQQRLSRVPGAVDSVIQGERVRLVMEPGRQPGGPMVADLELNAADPRFEDGFVAALRGEGAEMTSADAAESTGRANTKPGDTVIEVAGLSRRFGDFEAVKDLSFTVQRGEVFGLLGANGAGKSTTFRMLCGLLPASEGRLSVAGVDLRSAAAAARQRIGYVSQRFALYGNLTVRQNLRFFASAYNLTGRRRAQRVEWAMDSFQLEEMANADSETLPLGYKQRLALAAALMHEPDILFLDEPTSGVDPLARREFWGWINRLAGEGVTVLITTHFLEEADYCDRLAIMAAGEMLAVGEPRAVKEQVAAGGVLPSMEEAFIRLIQRHDAVGEAS